MAYLAPETSQATRSLLSLLPSTHKLEHVDGPQTHLVCAPSSPSYPLPKDLGGFLEDNVYRELIARCFLGLCLAGS